MAKISNSQLIPNKTVEVQGEIVFSRVTRMIDGEELKKRDANSRYPHTRPYTTMTLANCKVIPEVAGKVSVNEQYIIEKMFTSKTHPERNWCLTVENKGNSLPTICQGELQQDGKKLAKQILPSGELANGLHVTILIRVFKGNPNCGVSLDTVIVDEPIRYYSSVNSAALESRGITIIPDANASQAARSGQYYEAPVHQEVPVQEPISAPTGNPFQAQPVAQPVTQAAAPIAQPQVTQTPVQAAQPQQTPQSGPFTAAPVTPVAQPTQPVEQPVAAASPVAQSPVAAQPETPVAASPVAGIVYNAGSRNY